ncbi:MAG: FimB/Mfa2 family fimbrial subunit [Prevotella sp.]|jgi:uncharacterized protein (TIGR02145 family)|nr:FimB/Mfa2 family fimbrial subunit [Prevotella sp.]
MKKAILSVVLLASGLLSGCSSEESVSRPETIGQTGTLTFSFPAPRRSVTYAPDESDPLTATEDEAAINDVTVYMFRSAGDLLLVAKKSASPTEVEARSVTFDVNKFTSGDAGYTFYAVANVSGNIEDNFVVGRTNLDDFTSAVATNTGADPIPGSNMLMAGYTTIAGLSTSTESAQTITLRHRVARFDIDNVADDGEPGNNNDASGDETFFEITKIHVTNTLSAGYLTAEDNAQGREDIDDRVSLRGADAIDVSGVSGINDGLARGAFYLWPGKLDNKDNLSEASTLIEVEGVYTGDGKPVVYKVLLADDQPIVANKRYILKVSRIDRTNLVFALEVSQWDDGEELTAVASVDAVEYTGFSLYRGALSDNGIDLSNNTDTDTLRFTTLSENRATGDLKASFVPTLGTGYAANDFTPVAEGEPVVTYAGAKVSQTYRIVFPKTTYPIAGVLTIEEEVTTNKKIFDITSVPVYEGTIYRPILVEGDYSGAGPVESRYWAPLNVGATSTTYSATVGGCGHYFQWGRNVPFTAYDSSGDTYSGPVYADTPQEDYMNKFITSNSIYFNDWLSPQDDGLWSGAKAQGPCPAGWRVPTDIELAVLSNLYVSTNISSGRLRISGKVAGQYLYLPIAGGRNVDGSWSSREQNGRYWSSIVSDTNATRLQFNSTSSNLNGGNRAGGYSVRCIQN